MAVSSFFQRRTTRTFFKHPERDLWVFHLDFTQKVHVRKAFDHVALPALREPVVISDHGKFEGGIRDIAFPERPNASVCFV